MVSARKTGKQLQRTGDGGVAHLGDVVFVDDGAVVQRDVLRGVAGRGVGADQRVHQRLVDAGAVDAVDAGRRQQRRRQVEVVAQCAQLHLRHRHPSDRSSALPSHPEAI